MSWLTGPADDPFEFGLRGARIVVVRDVSPRAQLSSAPRATRRRLLEEADDVVPTDRPVMSLRVTAAFCIASRAAAARLVRVLEVLDPLSVSSGGRHYVAIWNLLGWDRDLGDRWPPYSPIPPRRPERSPARGRPHDRGPLLRDRRGRLGRRVYSPTASRTCSLPARRAERDPRRSRHEQGGRRGCASGSEGRRRPEGARDLDPHLPLGLRTDLRREAPRLGYRSNFRSTTRPTNSGSCAPAWRSSSATRSASCPCIHAQISNAKTRDRPRRVRLARRELLRPDGRRDVLCALPAQVFRARTPVDFDDLLIADSRRAAAASRRPHERWAKTSATCSSTSTRTRTTRSTCC